MRVITFVTQKGGSGKSTLAFCCGVRAEETGKRVLLLDMDPQATTELWFRIEKLKDQSWRESIRETLTKR
jgi:chromosome partitioning protein